MTILIGVLCQDGVVVGADSSATFGAGPQYKTIEQKCKKIEVVEEKVIVAGTGQVGLGQRFNYVVQEYWKERGFQKHHLEVGRELSAKCISNFASSQVAKGQYGSLLAYTAGGKYHLCEFAIADFQPEFKDSNMWYVSMGSGQLIVDPFLGLMRKVFWGDSPPRCNEGIFYVAWALQHAIELNPGGINEPMQIAVLQSTGGGNIKARCLDDQELSEHLDHVRGVNEYLAKYKDILQGRIGSPDIKLPEPPTTGE